MYLEMFIFDNMEYIEFWFKVVRVLYCVDRNCFENMDEEVVDMS